MALTLACFPIVAFAQTPRGAADDASDGEGWTGHASYVIGYKRLEGRWSPAADQFEFGLIDVDFGKRSWPVSIAGQLLLSYTGDTPRNLPGNNSGTYEVNLGLRKVFNQDAAVQPFIGGGVSLIGASTGQFIRFNRYESANVREDGAVSAGFWAGAGLYWAFHQHWHTGLAIQYSWGELRLAGKDLNAGGVHALGLVGYRW
jgi:hypothetical protein